MVDILHGRCYQCMDVCVKFHLNCSRLEVKELYDYAKNKNTM